MHPFFEKAEHYNHLLIPVALAALLVVIFFQLFVHTQNRPFNLIIEIMDGLVIAVFVTDLIFLAVRSKNTRFFFRNYWLDIVAVFPFALMFNVVEQIYLGITAAERIVIGQSVFHEGLEAEKLLKEGAKEGRLVRMLRVVPRGLRWIAKSHLCEGFRKKRHQKIRKK